MPTNQIVARFKDGRTLKGETSDFFPGQQFFHLDPIDGPVERVHIDDLKAVFFVKDYTGDKDRKDKYEEEVKGVGRKMKVTMVDGEVIVGYSAGYSRDRQGFFLVPADSESNNERIFIVNDSCREAKIL